MESKAKKEVTKEVKKEVKEMEKDYDKGRSPRSRSPSPPGSRYSSRSSHSSRSASPKSPKNQKDNKNQKDTKNQSSKQGKKEKGGSERQGEIEKKLQEWEKLRQQENEKKKKELEESRKFDKTQKDESEKKKKKDEIEEIERLMLEAAEKQEVKKLRKSLTKIEDKDLEDPFSQVYDDAKLLVISDERKEYSKSAQSKISQSMVSEIRSFKRPPDVVYDVVRATLTVLGYDDSAMKDWPSSRKEFIVSGRDAFHKRINAYDASYLAPETGNKALKLLDGHEREDAYAVCQSVGTFYDWAAGVAEEAVSTDAKQSKTRKKQYKTAVAKQRDAEKKKKKDLEKEKEKEKMESTKKY